MAYGEIRDCGFIAEARSTRASCRRASPAADAMLRCHGEGREHDERERTSYRGSRRRVACRVTRRKRTWQRKMTMLTGEHCAATVTGHQREIRRGKELEGEGNTEAKLPDMLR